jgi:hypothetical protein
MSYSSKKSSKSLADFLWSKENYMKVCRDDDKDVTLSLPALLTILMSKMKDKILFKSDFNKPELINKLYDIINESLIQFSLFLSYHSDSSAHYGQLLPENAWSLLQELKVSQEMAYKLIRASVKPLYKMDEKEWQDTVTRMKLSFDCLPHANMLVGGGPDEDKLSKYLAVDRSKFWLSVSPELFTLFWILETENIYVPTEAYAALTQLQLPNRRTTKRPQVRVQNQGR